MDALLGAVVGVIVTALVGLVWVRSRRPDAALGGPDDLATYATLHTASLAAPALRAGLDADGAAGALPHVRALLGGAPAALTDGTGVLASSGEGDHALAAPLVEAVLAEGRTQASDRAVVAPLVVDELVVGTLVVLTSHPAAGIVRATTEVARWMSSQLELSELAASRTALMEAELRALRAQISPHFIYNSLGAIASFVRTDPERARGLLLEFADFTRYSFRRHGDFTTLADELLSIERYLALENARFGDRLRVTSSVAPEVLNVALPFLAVQPLVENAVRHGIEPKDGPGHITVVARDVGTACLIEIEDDGVGSDPDVVREALAGRASGGSIGLANVDQRLRAVYGNDHGIVVETAPGLGTKVSLRIPKFSPDART
ncbi:MULTISPECIES: sensor histidine kinase [unclassified Aeromicrobium]|uniref:sensor histidine kinase n=1 Tax=unclassified Aeromicrobium TaxID=2633570 RepID=UPI0006FA4A8B|nr:MULTISPECIES: histidine kinase [unclassified Aeromicrobium]KQP29280.1 histidine kinase [Aeromicrobium sp. Leaf272]KQP75569.1 histidine kinase [Aeromicrobium sp. Leaf289]KQP81545.1 histidine kinase [Aeromicrobium sp. Leaf291]